MSQVFQNQTLLTITVPTGYDDLASATATRIKYKKPSGRTGYFPGTVSGTDLIYDLQQGDITEWGLWSFQSWITVAGKEGPGEIITHFFEKQLYP